MLLLISIRVAEMPHVGFIRFTVRVFREHLLICVFFSPFQF